MGVVEEAGVTGVLDGGKSAACDVAAFDTEGLETGFAEIGLEDEAVVTCAEDDAVVDIILGRVEV